MNDDRLIHRYLDGALNAGELASFNQRLRQDTALRGELRDIAEQVVAMGDFARLVAAQRAPQPTVAATANHSWLALAASIVVLMASARLWMGGEAAPVLTVVEASGAVAWSEGGEWRAEVRVGEALAAGTLETIGEMASAQLRFPDGTLLSLTGDSELSFSDDEQKRLVLRRGSLAAQVQPQPDGQPMLVRTPSAEAEVIGTAFNLAARPEDTLLKVDEGMVKLKRLADGRAIEVPAKSSALASLDSASQFQSVATPEPLTRWSFDFTTTAAPRDWRGVSDGAKMTASPYVASRTASGGIVTHFGISVRAAQLQPPVALVASDTSVIRYRLKQDEPAPLQVMLLTAKPSGGFGGNFEARINADELQPDRDGWCDVAIPIGAFRPLAPKHASPIGHILTSVLLSSFQKDTKLTVSHFALTTRP